MGGENPEKLISELSAWMTNMAEHSSQREIFFAMACVSLHEPYVLGDDVQAVDELIKDIVDKAKTHRMGRVH